MFSTNSDQYSFLKPQDLHPPISFFPFPSPFEFGEEFDDLFLQPYNFITCNSENNATNNNPSPEKSNTMAGNGIINSASSEENKKKMNKIPRKRMSKKDRHSKISTARGLRDRRMRLSLPVARQFFGLQDMLGVDKGSKTVEWLLLQARPQILKLANDTNFSFSSSQYSNHSEADVAVSGIEDDQQNGNNKKMVKKMKSLKEKKKKRAKLPRKTMAKELREKARARARARTMEKKNLTKISSSWSSPLLETGEESGATHSYNNNLNLEPETSQFGTSQQPIIDFQNYSSLEIMLNWSPSHSTFNYLHQIGTLDFQQQHEFDDSQFFG